jgi:uncharacterized protein with NAD-binding domain and iron-sulfur cluster
LSGVKRTGRVAIFGAGITGLTIAHECAEAGLSVSVYEKAARVGGKALSFRLPPDHAFAGAPVEHSIRAFQSWYASFYETLKRVPHPDGGTAFEKIRPLTGLRLTPGGGPLAEKVQDSVLDTSASRSPISKLHDLYSSMRGWGATRGEFARFLIMVLDYLASDDERRRRVFGPRTFAEHARLDSRSEGYREYVTSLAEIAVAAKPHASAEVVMDLLGRLLTGSLNNVHRLPSLVAITDGPTGECLIDPWVSELHRLGAQVHTAMGLEKLDVGPDGRATAATLADGTRVEADVYVLAIPHRAILEVAPSLADTTGLGALRDEFSNGFQFLLSAIPERFASQRTFNMVFGSAWRLVYLVEGPPVWSDLVRLAPGVRAVLSITASRLDHAGSVHGKSFFECTWEEVQDELLTQAGFRERDLIVYASPDPMLRYVSEEEYTRGKDTEYRGWTASPVNARGCRWISQATLCVATPESRAKPFPVKTAIGGVFMAGEFTNTATRTPNMEKANQAGKLCARAIFDELGLSYPVERLKAPRVPLAGLAKLRR